MKLFTFLYSIYGLIIFSSLWIFFSIPLLFGIWFKSFLNFAYWCHHLIARFFFALIFIPVKIKLEKNVDLKKHYIIISNHFSYIDIPAIAALNIPFKFIGKIQVNNIPLLGYIFKNLHIMVNREDKNSRKNTPTPIFLGIVIINMFKINSNMKPKYPYSGKGQSFLDWYFYTPPS